MSFKIIDGGGPNKEERERQEKDRERQRDQEWTNNDFSYALRECAANVLRVVRGAGKPYELLVQMQEVVNKAVNYREAHGHYPSSDLIQAELALHDEYEHQRERGDRGEISQESRNILREHREFDRLYALHIINRGALQIAASGLIGQDTQQRAGESELHRGLRMWEQWLEERDRKAREAARVSRANPKRGRSIEKPVVPKASLPAVTAPAAAPRASQSKQNRKKEAFGQDELKELRKAIKAKDSKKIAELTAKIGQRPSDD